MAQANSRNDAAREIVSSVFLNRWTCVVDRRDLPPIALLGLTAAMLRNVSIATLVNTLGPALRAMVELAEQDVEAFFEDDRVFTFEAWLESFEFEPQGIHQTECWGPFVAAMKALPGIEPLAGFDQESFFYERCAGMMLWLTLHTVFDTVWMDHGEIETEVLPDNRWLVSLVPDKWNPWQTLKRPGFSGGCSV